MVEYAILFIVLSILFIGGAELGMAALASYKNTDAAKTGISEYAEVNQKRIDLLNAEKQYLIDLSSYTCNSIQEVSNADGLTSYGVCSTSGAYPNFVNYLDALYESAPDADTAFNEQLNGLIEEAASLMSAEANSPSNMLSELESLIGNGDGILTLSEATLGMSMMQNSIVPAATQHPEGQLKFRFLLLITHYQLSLLPLLTDTDNDGINDTFLSTAIIRIGNHASGLFRQPSCLEGDGYDYGFPEDRYISSTGEGSTIYLFNPLPINAASCVGQDSSRGQSKLSILVSGYGAYDDLLYEPGLPALNQAMYGMYKKDTNGNLTLPGKMCQSDEDCPFQPNSDLYGSGIGPSGFYRWNKGSDGSGLDDLFKYTITNVNDELQNGFRPTLQIDCNTTSSHTDTAINDTNCQSTHTKVRLHTRYRKLFEGFLTFGLQELNVDDGELDSALLLFYNPNNVGVPGSNQVNGTIDSEIGPLGANLKPTIKRHKDFRGCYEVDVQTNFIKACN